eukprot:CAMPEP_0118723398 /NCGR_PEP_ID=MMETSP0800-20121206/31982_1 /TAXON_ID=210618 ORGANISM="Striatella unipunctata, Strain CCMP2910" /NCGR_SAMPLE_ID=MMETSP0800 /ASSEMBLY_ACC=CAM_ASM_000638 /LENGTH=87 /DNA_ID=CAMNT_0006631821 /DNA_START=304 /DNA_END=563 /DNA_ORIENTATION=+
MASRNGSMHVRPIKPILFSDSSSRSANSGREPSLLSALDKLSQPSQHKNHGMGDPSARSGRQQRRTSLPAALDAHSQAMMNHARNQA